MILPVDTRAVERQKTRVQFEVRVARDTVDSFVSIGLIDGEIDDFITTEAVKSEGSQTFANSEGFLNTIRFTATTQTLLNNTSIFNLESLDKGLWYLQFKAVYGTLNFVTPQPVSLKVIGKIRTGNAKSQSAIIETFFYTQNLNWIKDARPTRPTLVKPSEDKRTEGTPPFPAEATLNRDEPFVLRVSNFAIPEPVRPFVFYDVFIYSNAARTVLAASRTNIPTSQLVESDYIITSDSDLTGYSNLLKGTQYFGKIVAKYIGLESFPLLFSFTFALDVPTFSVPPSPENLSSIPVIPTLWQWNAVNGANAYDFEYQAGVSSPVIVSRIGFANTTNVLDMSLSTLSSVSLRVRVRAKNNVTVSGWSASLDYTLRERDFAFFIDGAGSSTVNPVNVLQGQTGLLTIGISRPENGTESIRLVNNNDGLPKLNLPFETGGLSIQRTVTVGAIERNVYSPQISGSSPLNSLTRTATYYVSVRDLRDHFGSDLVAWFKAEDLTLTDNENVVNWLANNRSGDPDLKWQQLAAAQQPIFRTAAQSSNPNPFRNIITPNGIKSYPSVLIQQTNRMDLKSLIGANKNLDLPALSLYFVMAMHHNPLQTRTLMCDSANPQRRAIQSYVGVGAFYAGYYYGSSIFAFDALGEQIGLWTARWTNNGTSTSTSVLRRNNSSALIFPNLSISHTPSLASVWRLNRLGGTTSSDVTSSFPYYLAEMIVFGRYLSDSEDALVNGYFLAKYGTPF